jgi:acyl-CoA thioesterase-1
MKAGILSMIALIFLLSSCSQATPPPTATPQPETRGVIVAVGDSLTEGWGVDESEAYPALLEQKLRANGYLYQVVNAGVSAETSSGTLSRVNWVLNLNPDIVILGQRRAAGHRPGINRGQPQCHY